jgi:cytochrome-b5 reductase
MDELTLRLAHSVRAGDGLEVRGPIPTFSIKPSEYDRIVMVSTGTGVAPFLQLLSRMNPSPSPGSGPRLELVHLQPEPDRVDWAVSSGLIPALQDKHGDRLGVHRPEAGQISVQTMREALGTAKGDRIMVLVCLPPQSVDG